MPQAKKKQTTKTAKKTAPRGAKSKAAKRSCSTTRNVKGNSSEKWHVYILTALSMVTAILLCTDAAIFAVL